jgi:hypothetical protein
VVEFSGAAVAAEVELLVPGILMAWVYFTSLCAIPALRMLVAATAMNLQIDCVFDISFSFM